MAGLNPPTVPTGIPHWRYLDTNFDGTGLIDMVGNFLVDFKVPGFRSLYRGFKVWRSRYYIKDSGGTGWASNRYSTSVLSLARWTNLSRADFWTGIPGVSLHEFGLCHNEREFTSCSCVTRVIQDFSGVNDRWLIYEFDYRPMGGITISRFERIQAIFLDDYSSLDGHRVSIEMEYLIDNNSLDGSL